MSSAQSQARIGKWTDFTTGETALLVDSTWGYIMVAFAGVWLSLSVKYLKKILANFALLFHLWWHKPRPNLDNDEVQTEASSLLGTANPSRKKAQPLAKVYKETEGVRDYIWELLTNRKLSLPYRFCLLAFTVLVSLVALGMIVGGVYSAKVKTNGPARMLADQCGLWMFNQDRGGEEAAVRAGVRDQEKETRAAEYAQNCYGSADTFDATRCDFFYRRNLSFGQPEYTTDCPFQNKICRMNQTVTFTTNTVDGSEIGINSPAAPKFRRSTKCTPLSMESPFITNETENGITTYKYYYGKRPGHSPPSNYTYSTVGDPYERLAPVYDVFTYVTSPTNSGIYWEPTDELTYPEYSTLTIVFVSSLRILYKEESHDPIFPADEKVVLPGEQKSWYRNSDPRARPFACINSIEVCLADGTTCWAFNGPSPEETEPKKSIPPEFWMMYASLLKTDIFDSIIKRLGRALLAQKLVSGYFSEALTPDCRGCDEHWVKEIKNLVATSHARTQINAWSIASGEDSKYRNEGYDLVTPRETFGNFCENYKFNPTGYASIRFAAFVTIICTLPILFILSWDWTPISRGFHHAVIKFKGSRVSQRQRNGAGARSHPVRGEQPSGLARGQIARGARPAEITGAGLSQSREEGERSSQIADPTLRASEQGHSQDTGDAEVGGPAQMTEAELLESREQEERTAQIADPISRASAGPGRLGAQDTMLETDEDTDIKWEPLIISFWGGYFLS